MAVTTGGATAGGNPPRGIARPGPVPADASETERIARLERYVEHIDSDLSNFWQEIRATNKTATSEASAHADRVRAEIAARDDEHRQWLRRSSWRQLGGATCVMAGLVLTTIGSV